MRRWFGRVLMVSVVAAAAACAQEDPFLPTGPTTPPTVRSDTFSGTLVRNAAYTHPFTVGDGGPVSVYLLTSVDVAHPDNNAIPIGVSLGTWNGTSCAIVIASDNTFPVTPEDVTKGKVVGQATAAGNLCVRVYDVGFVPGASSYELLIDHY